MDEAYLQPERAGTAPMLDDVPAERLAPCPSLTPAPSVRPIRPIAPPVPPAPEPSLLRRLRWLGPLGWLLLALAVLGIVVAFEFRTASWQAEQIAPKAAAMRWQLGPGRSPAIAFPQGGPFDIRLGYARLPAILERLEARGYGTVHQARLSPEMLTFAERGYFPPYEEKVQAGLTIRDSYGAPVYKFRYPQQGYATFDDIPPLVWRSLLYIENRDLLDPTRARLNPAVDWPRFATAALRRAGKLVGLVDGSSAGASTLATQLEKYRHSPDGLTRRNEDKLRQMLSATVRAYRDGPDTRAARRRIVRDYLNSVPLSAFPGYGEVHGIADGLRVWFGADFDAVNAALAPGSAAPPAERGRALRQVVTLVIAQRRPSYYLSNAGRRDLERLVDAHLRVLASGGVIDASLRDAALDQRVLFADEWNSPPAPDGRGNGHSRATNVARAHLAGLFGVPLYDLDRMDVEAGTTLDTALQAQVNAHLRRLLEPAYALQAGLVGEYLLAPEKTADVRYSFTLLERTDDAWRVRVQTDSTAQAFDINEHSKLELGSTAKLRVLTAYLQVVAELHDKYASLTSAALRRVVVAEDDALSRWAVDWLTTARQRDLAFMLDAALERRYSAAPWERFFTGGGLHTFNNFRPEDDYRIPTVREALKDSINLPFIRLLRDLVRYSIHQGPGSRANLFDDDRHPSRLEYLARFADREGTIYLRRFWNRYKDLPSQQRLALLLSRVHRTEPRYAAVHRYLSPSTGRSSFAAFLAASLPDPKRTPERVDELYAKFAPGQFSLTDQAYVAGIHPLELWLVSYLLQRPDATFADAVAASRQQRQDIYGWLYKSRHKAARDSRVRIMLEEEAFLDLHRRWAELGFPFERLVPSLATAIGSSGDRPAALAELMGIIRNDGVRLPVVRIDRIRFGADTPYETLVEHVGQPRRVLREEVAAALRVALADVVEDGTARRLAGAFVTTDGEEFAAGGKTGTGDNRVESVSRSGFVLRSTALNRTATFVFYLGDNHVGTVTAFVPGRAAERFTFTSALPVQVLKSMAPLLVPYLDGAERRTRPAPSTLPETILTSTQPPEAIGPPTAETVGPPPADASAPEPPFSAPPVFDVDAPPAPTEATARTDSGDDAWQPAPLSNDRTAETAEARIYTAPHGTDEWSVWSTVEPGPHAALHDDDRRAIDDEGAPLHEGLYDAADADAYAPRRERFAPRDDRYAPRGERYVESDAIEPEVDADAEAWLDDEAAHDDYR